MTVVSMLKIWEVLPTMLGTSVSTATSLDISPTRVQNPSGKRVAIGVRQDQNLVNLSLRCAGVKPSNSASNVRVEKDFGSRRIPSKLTKLEPASHASHASPSLLHPLQLLLLLLPKRLGSISLLFREVMDLASGRAISFDLRVGGTLIRSLVVGF